MGTTAEASTFRSNAAAPVVGGLLPGLPSFTFHAFTIASACSRAVMPSNTFETGNRTLYIFSIVAVSRDAERECPPRDTKSSSRETVPKGSVRIPSHAHRSENSTSVMLDPAGIFMYLKEFFSASSLVFWYFRLCRSDSFGSFVTSRCTFASLASLPVSSLPLTKCSGRLSSSMYTEGTM